MQVVILSPDEEIYTGEADSVKVPGTSGQFEIRNGHAAIVSSLEQGVVSIKGRGSEDFTIKIRQGFVEVLNNEVAVLIVPEEA